jgi:hypothetical protein
MGKSVEIEREWIIFTISFLSYVMLDEADGSKARFEVKNEIC